MSSEVKGWLGPNNEYQNRGLEYSLCPAQVCQGATVARHDTNPMDVVKWADTNEVKLSPLARSLPCTESASP